MIKTDNMNWVFLIINVIWACFAIYQMIKANKENGLFDTTYVLKNK